jgi:hypothetical protein
MRCPLTPALLITVTNHGVEPITIRWDECAYIDVDRQSHRLLTAEANRNPERPTPQRSLIAPGARLEEVLVPVGLARDRGIDPLLPVRPSTLLVSPLYVGNPSRVPPWRRQELIGKEIGVFLALERRGERKTVLATYAITQIATGPRRR